MIHIPKMYISPPCARRAHRNPSTYIHPPSVGMIYPIPSYIFKSYIFQKCTFPHPVPEGHTETHQLKYIPQVLAWYIQYQGIYSTDLYSQIVGTIYEYWYTKYKVALGSGLVRSEDCELVYEMESSTQGRGVGCWGSFGIEALFMERAHILRGGAETIIS